MSPDLFETVRSSHHNSRPGLAPLTMGASTSHLQMNQLWWWNKTDKYSTACFLFLFPSVALGAGKESACLSANRAAEMWNSFSLSSSCFYFEGLGSGMTFFLAKRQPGKWKPLSHQPNTRIRKNSPKSRSFSPPFSFPFSFSWPFLFVSLYSLGLVLNRSGGDHHHAELQRVIAASPGLPEDALLPLVSLFGRRTLEVSTVQVGATTTAEPPTTCRRQRPTSG